MVFAGNWLGGGYTSAYTQKELALHAVLGFPKSYTSPKGKQKIKRSKLTDLKYRRVDENGQCGHLHQEHPLMNEVLGFLWPSTTLDITMASFLSLTAPTNQETSDSVCRNKKIRTKNQLGGGEEKKGNTVY